MFSFGFTNAVEVKDFENVVLQVFDVISRFNYSRAYVYFFAKVISQRTKLGEKETNVNSFVVDYNLRLEKYIIAFLKS